MRFFLIFSIALASMFLTACSDDDDSAPDPSAQIVGTWDFEQAFLIQNGNEQEVTLDCFQDDKLEFKNSRATWYEGQPCQGSGGAPFSQDVYNLSDGGETLSIGDVDYQVNTLSATKLEIQSPGSRFIFNRPR